MFHYVKNGDTLAGLATEIGLENPVYLKEYNNAQCLPPDLIEEELEPGKRVLLPKLNEIEQYNALKDAPFRLPEANPSLDWKAGLQNRSYRVKVRNSIDGQDSGRFQYHTQLQLRNSGYGYRQLNWFRKDYRFDKTTKMGQLVQACTEAINPLLITIDAKGILQQISMDTEVQERWPEIKAALCDAFPDAYAAAYIEDLGYVLQQQHLVDKRMRQDPFIRIYFAALRVPFDKGLSTFSTSLTPETGTVSIQQTVATTDYTDTIPLIQSLAEHTVNNNGLYYQGKYMLDKEDSSIRSAMIHIRTDRNDRLQETYIELEEQ